MPHSSIWLLLLTFVVSGLSTLFCMPRLLKFCQQRGLYDIPNERKVHHNKIPRLGGLLFAPAMAAGMGMSYLLLTLCQVSTDLPVFRLSTLVLMAGLFLVYLIGILDDVLGLKASFKFCVQLAATLLMPLCNLHLNNFYGFCGIHELPLWASYPLTVFVCLLIVNSINLIDGIDGLSSGLSVITLVAFTVLFGQLGVLSYNLLTMGLLGSVLAFFYYNVFGSEARGTKTFMGDTGSLVLGYAIAYLAIKYAMHNPAVFPLRPHALLISFSLVLVPCFDLVRVAFGRIGRGVGIFHPDKTHLHHLCLSAGFSMHRSLLMILALQIGFILMNYILFELLGASVTFIVPLDIFLFALFVHFLRVKQKKITKPISAPKTERRT